LLAQFILDCAHAVVSRQLPSEHQEYIFEHLQATSKSEYAGAHFLARQFSKIDAATTFTEGLKLMLDGFETWLGKERTVWLAAFTCTADRCVATPAISAGFPVDARG